MGQSGRGCHMHSGMRSSRRQRLKLSEASSFPSDETQSKAPHPRGTDMTGSDGSDGHSFMWRTPRSFGSGIRCRTKNHQMGGGPGNASVDGGSAPHCQRLRAALFPGASAESSTPSCFPTLPPHATTPAIAYSPFKFRRLPTFSC